MAHALVAQPFLAVLFAILGPAPGRLLQNVRRLWVAASAATLAVHLLQGF
jgi:hypothetical protein